MASTLLVISKIRKAKLSGTGELAELSGWSGDQHRVSVDACKVFTGIDEGDEVLPVGRGWEVRKAAARSVLADH